MGPFKRLLQLENEWNTMWQYEHIVVKSIKESKAEKCGVGGPHFKGGPPQSKDLRTYIKGRKYKFRPLRCYWRYPFILKYLVEKQLKVIEWPIVWARSQPPHDALCRLLIYPQNIHSKRGERICSFNYTKKKSIVKVRSQQFCIHCTLAFTIFQAHLLRLLV